MLAYHLACGYSAPLLKVIFLCLHTGPPTLGLPLVLCQRWQMLWNFAISPHMDHTAMHPLDPVLLGLSPVHEDQASGERTP